MDAFVSTDMDGRIKEYNETYRNMLGYQPEEISALACSDLTPEKWRDLKPSLLKNRFFKEGIRISMKRNTVRKMVGVYPVELRMFLLKDDAGKPAGMWAIVRDISRAQTGWRKN